jgi:excisionase family DNA binding protein
MLNKQYTVREVAKILGIHEHTLYRWIKQGKIDSIRLGYKTIRITQQQLDDFLEQNKKGI